MHTDPPIHPKKGRKYGACNRRACQSRRRVYWWNSGSNAYYCEWCARKINDYCNEDDLLCAEEPHKIVLAPTPEAQPTVRIMFSYEVGQEDLRPQYEFLGIEEDLQGNEKNINIRGHSGHRLCFSLLEVTFEEVT